MGTPQAAVPALRALHAAHEVAAVYTQPDKPKGRGRQVQPSPVKQTAQELGVDVVQPRTLRDDDAVAELARFRPEAIAVVAYGKILPASVLELPARGCLNVHFSLLPRWRGAAPVARAILAGDTSTGVTTMLMDEGLDTGPMLRQIEEPIGRDDTTGTLTARLAERGAELLLVTLDDVAAGRAQPRPQPDEGVTYADKIEGDEAELDWGAPATTLERTVRALDPAPGAFTRLGSGRVKVWRAAVVAGAGEPGTVASIDADGPVVQAGEQRLRLLDVQPEGKRRMTGAEFVRGHPLKPGDTLSRP